MTWFVDKLGPAPNRATSQQPARGNGAAKQAAPPTRQQQAQAKAAPPPKAAPAPAPEPEKKKKKGWF
jgi:hypothetical protein